MTGGATPRRRGRPPRVTRDQILTTALRLVDRDGLERLTMRRLGAELGVDPMAIYGHIPDKAALFDGFIEYVLADIELPVPTGEWVEDFRAVTRAARTTLLNHPHVVSLLGTRPPVTEPAFALLEAITSILLDAGFTEEQSADGFDCAGRLIVGHVLAEAGRPPGGDVDGGEDRTPRGPAIPTGRTFPGLDPHSKAGVRHDPDRLFEMALNGLTLTLDAHHPAR